MLNKNLQFALPCETLRLPCPDVPAGGQLRSAPYRSLAAFSPEVAAISPESLDNVQVPHGPFQCPKQLYHARHADVIHFLGSARTLPTS